MLQFLKNFKGHEAKTWDPDVTSPPPQEQKSPYRPSQDPPNWDSGSTSEPPKKKKGPWQRLQEAKRKEIPPEEVFKYTGSTKEQILEWAKTEPGLAGNGAPSWWIETRRPNDPPLSFPPKHTGKNLDDKK
ncbi:hypothetical protein B0T14DRAFT_146642 [Immersiella caudata]|uniref:Uncharacterized protein n=1 Tax=Immersiella caudata TaxID=314043 RepID=A0AA40C730_9PEZI|nr:hypothetical protein B0T14DRAFT_146642 [Immersiella caudata]